MLIVLAAAKLLFHILTNGHYGFHRDELVTLADARHLDWGFVAYPPITPLLGRIELALFGTSLAGFRFFAALAQSIAMVITGLMARRMGGDRAAMFIAACAAAVAPLSLAASAMFQYVSFDYLWFVLMAYFVVRLVDSNDPRWWLAIGAVIGIAVETKYTIAFFVAGLVAGVFATPLRAHLRSKWLWLGAALSILIALPNLIWQVQHDFITLEFLKHIHARDIRWGRTSHFLLDQFKTATNPFTVPLWISGLYVLIRDKRYRVLAFMAVVPFVLFYFAQGRGYYIAPVYPMLFAAGAAAMTKRALRVAMAFAIAIGGVAVAMIVLPLSPINSRLFKFAAKQNHDLVEEIGWPELTAEVARIYQSLPADERAHTGIFCNNYGEAGAVDLYGPALGLPHALSGTNSYWLRGPGSPVPTTLIVLGDSRKGIDEACDEVTLAGHTPNPYNVENEETSDHPDIFLCRKLRTPLEKLWPRLKSFG